MALKLPQLSLLPSTGEYDLVLEQLAQTNFCLSSLMASSKPQKEGILSEINNYQSNTRVSVKDIVDNPNGAKSSCKLGKSEK